jgi:glycosyltransferase involved in cell wall biosynthesis
MNAADTARFVGVPVTQDPSDRFVLTYHGTLTRIYGLDLAIEAFALAKDRMPGAEFWILGSGTEQPALAAQASAPGLNGAVKLIGQVPAGDIPKWLSKSTVGVLPIRTDALLEYAFPNKLPEYIIMGKPTIISRLRAIRHYFSEDALAFAEPGNVADLAEQMVRLYQDPGLRRTLAENAAREYTPIRWDIMKQRYLDIVGELSGMTATAAAMPASTGSAVR